VLLAAGSLALLSGCGGGGGGGAADTGSGIPPPLTLTLSTTTVSATGAVSDATPPTATIDITVTNAPAGQNVYLGAGASNNGVAALSAAQTSQGKVTVTITFKNPGDLAPGIYHDKLRFVACSDQACNNVIAGSEQDATANYTVTAPSISDGPQLVLSPNTIQVSANPQDLSPPAQQMVNITFSQPISVPHFTMTVTQTTQGIQWVQQGTSTTGGNLTIAFKAPSDVLPGTYTDTVTVQGCYDANCVNPLGTPQALAVTYTIPTSVGGPQGYALAVYPLPANDLLWDPVHKVIYLSVPSAAGANGNTVAAIDPTSGAVMASVSAGSEPGTLAISDDAQFLYVAQRGANTIQRFVLPALTPDITIQLPSDPFFGPIYANDLKVMPGAPHTLAVARTVLAEPNSAGVQIFDDAVPRPNTTTGPGLGQSVNSIEWAGSAAKLLAADSLPACCTDQNIYFLSVSAAGVAITGQTQNGAGQGRLYYVGGLVYDDSGALADPTILNGNAVIASCTPEITFQARAEAIDAPQQKVFQLANYGNAVHLLSYQTGTCAEIASIGFGGVPLDAYSVPHLIRWGSNGLAFLSQDGKLITITGAFVAP
jgi:hypothetical protein